MDYDKMRMWVAALRSGKYFQGTGALNRGDEYCCLGVACEVAMANGLPVTKDRNVNGEIGYDGQTAFLPEVVKEWFGMKYETGEFDNPKAGEDYDEPKTLELHELNDEGMPFDEIADVIELNWRKL